MPNCNAILQNRVLGRRKARDSGESRYDPANKLSMACWNTL
jgi:hypothetical protein